MGLQETGAQSIYFAPLEGITGYIFRNAYNEIYGNVDKYFAPFISPTGRSSMTPRDRRDLDPDNNTGMNLIPQILTCDASLFIMAAGELQDMGYKEIDLNLGCPSGTVCAKGKGAGFLPETVKLRSFLDGIYAFSENAGIKISVKTRLGYYDPEEFFDLIEIFNAYPISELIVHPRIRGDFYKGEIRREYFAYAIEHAVCPLIYNGDIYTPQDLEDLSSYFKTPLSPVMLGRGLITDPSLASKIKGISKDTDMARFKEFHDTIYHEYQKVMSPDINVLYKMKELWSYWSAMFSDNSREIKKLLKAKNYADYESCVYSLLGHL